MMKIIKYTSIVLVLIGAINWGLVGIFNFDLVAFLFGETSIISRIIYILVGISALIAATFICMHCEN